jgi:hypothetical protein
MAETHWEKQRILAKGQIVKRSGRWKYLVIGLIILAAMAYLLVTSVGARYYVTVEELLADEDMHGKTVRVRRSGWRAALRPGNQYAAFCRRQYS